MDKKTTTITKVIKINYTITDASPEDGIVFDFTKFRDTRKKLGLRLDEDNCQCLSCNKPFKDGDRMYMVITDKGNFFVCKDCIKKIRYELGKPDYVKPENQHLNKLIYYPSVREWVDSLPYGVPIGEQGGYIYENPLDHEPMYGEKPTTVYDRLFKEDNYYGLTDNELNTLRSTIQYMPVYLDDFFEKVDAFLKKQGFKRYIKQGKRGDLIHAYYKRNNISLYVSNLDSPQDFRPNTITMEIAELVPNGNKKKRVQRESFAQVPMLDDFGELTRQSFENYIKDYVKEIKM